MKYAVIIPDGMADYELEALGGQTALQAAETPNFDTLARIGTVGTVRTIPEDMEAGSEIANLSILGYDPHEYFTGRGPLEAAAQGISIGERDVAFRCNLVTSDGEALLDYSAGHITTEEAEPLIRLVDGKLGGGPAYFFPGISYRHLMIWADDPILVQTTPPHNVEGQALTDIMPVGDRDARLRQMMYDSMEILDDHEINRRRRDEGQNPANMIWPWGGGRRPDMPSFFVKYGLDGAVICAVDLIKGIGRLAGLKHVPVPGATGYIDTDYEAKGDYAVRALREHDFVYVHVEAPDEASHLGDAEKKVAAIEQCDRFVLGTVLDHRHEFDDVRIMVLPDHYTPIGHQPAHMPDPVPFLVDRPLPGKGGFTVDEFWEGPAGETGLHVSQGHELMDLFMA
ncbi:MAG: cofactor-independent phosphoglycerate mutase [Armatimonadota bacterium]